MSYSIVFSSATGNTKKLADAIRESLPEKDCVYFGETSKEALKGDVIFVGFWTFMSRADDKTVEFLKALKNKIIFLFGSAGYMSDEYKVEIINNTKAYISDDVKIIGSFMCQGKMRETVRDKYSKLAENPETAEKGKSLLKMFEEALKHPDDKDIADLKQAVRSL